MAAAREVAVKEVAAAGAIPLLASMLSEAPSADAPDEELISLVFFHEPDAEAVIAPFPTCISASDPARYEPILSKDYLAEKFAALEVG